MTTPAQIWPWISLALCLASPAVASFGQLLADRIASGAPARLMDRSRCDHCLERLHWRDLIPVVSWLALRGRSRCCDRVLRRALIAAEVAGLAGGIWAISVTQGTVLLTSIGLFWVLLVLGLIDFATYRLPDPGTLGLVLAGLGLSLFGLTGPVSIHALGAICGFLVIYALRWVWIRLRGVEAIGLGDAKLLAAAGAWLGVLALPSVLLWACLSGLALASLIAVRQGSCDLQTAIPFGPALAFGCWVTWLHGPVMLPGV